MGDRVQQQQPNALAAKPPPAIPQEVATRAAPQPQRHGDLKWTQWDVMPEGTVVGCWTCAKGTHMYAAEAQALRPAFRTFPALILSRDGQDRVDLYEGCPRCKTDAAAAAAQAAPAQGNAKASPTRNEIAATDEQRAALEAVLARDKPSADDIATALGGADTNYNMNVWHNSKDAMESLDKQAKEQAKSLNNTLISKAAASGGKLEAGNVINIIKDWLDVNKRSAFFKFAIVAIFAQNFALDTNSVPSKWDNPIDAWNDSAHACSGFYHNYKYLLAYDAFNIYASRHDALLPKELTNRVADHLVEAFFKTYNLKGAGRKISVGELDLELVTLTQYAPESPANYFVRAELLIGRYKTHGHPGHVTKEMVDYHVKAGLQKAIYEGLQPELRQENVPIPWHTAGFRDKLHEHERTCRSSGALPLETVDAKLYTDIARVTAGWSTEERKELATASVEELKSIRDGKCARPYRSAHSTPSTKGDRRRGARGDTGKQETRVDTASAANSDTAGNGTATSTNKSTAKPILTPECFYCKEKWEPGKRLNRSHDFWNCPKSGDKETGLNNFRAWAARKYKDTLPQAALAVIPVDEASWNAWRAAYKPHLRPKN